MKDNTTSFFAERLQDLISDSGKTINILSKEIGISEGSLSKYQNNLGEAGIIKLSKLAQYFNRSTDYLLGLTEVKTPNTEIQAVTKMTGLSEEAVEHIRSITDMLRNYEQAIDKEKNIIPGAFTLEPKDVLIEILLSGRLLHLIVDIIYLTKDYSIVKKNKPIDNILKYANFPDEITESFNYRLWRANLTAQNLVSDVLESYYLKTKDGVVTYKLDSDNNIIRSKGE